LEKIVRRQLASSFQHEEIDAILLEAESDSPSAEFIVARALEAANEHDESVKWYRRCAEQGYAPALERLRRDSPNAA
jgi:TPR repeat protein